MSSLDNYVGRIYLRKWWVKTKQNTILKNKDGWEGILEICVPWWAWPLELLHRMIFGRNKLQEIK